MPAPEPVPAPPAPAAPAPESAATGVTQPAPAPAEGAPPGVTSEETSGVASKNGKTVLPYTVLREARHEASTAKQERDAANERARQLQADLDALKAQAAQRTDIDGTGKTVTLDDVIADPSLEQDFPALAAVAREVRALRQQIGTAAPAPTPTPPASPAGKSADQDVDERGEFDEALAACPLLTQARNKGGVLWARACEIDQQLQTDPAFRSKSYLDRFTAVQHALAGELGVGAPPPRAPAPQPAPAAPAPAAPAAPAAAPAVQDLAPNTLSDLAGGVSAGNDALNERASGMALARRFATMDNNAIAAAVRKFG